MASRLPSGRTVGDRLISACRSQSVATVRRLLAQHADILSHQESEAVTLMSPLAIAVEEGCFEIAEVLLDAGSEDSAISRDADGNTVMHIATRISRVDLLELYHCYCDTIIDWQNHHGLTPLHMAAKAGDVIATKTLLDLGADIDLPDLNGDTPLHYASSYGHKPVIRHLIERGANFQVKNERGWLAADYAYTLPVAQFLNEAVRQVFELNKREHFRRDAAKQAARLASSERSNVPHRPAPRSRVTSSGSTRRLGVTDSPASDSHATLETPPMLQRELPPTSPPSKTLAPSTSSSSLNPSSASLASGGTSGPSFGGPRTPPNRMNLPPPVIASPLGSGATSALPSSPPAVQKEQASGTPPPAYTVPAHASPRPDGHRR